MAFSLNSVALPPFVIVNDIRDSILPPVTQNLVKVVGRAGNIDYGNEIGNRLIEVDVTLVATGEEDLRDKVRDFANWLYYEEAKELVITDEPDKYYLAKVTGESGIAEILNVGQGTIQFICTDPYAYTDATTYTFKPIKDWLPETYFNNGTTEVFPRFDFTFGYDSTGLRITAPNGVIQFGRPKEVENTEVEPDPVRFTDNMSNTANWASAVGIGIDDGVITDTITSGGSVVTGGDVSPFYTKWDNGGYDAGYTAWYGMAGVQSLGYDLQDFRLETEFGLKATEAGQLGRVEVYFLDVNDVKIGKVSLALGNPNALTPRARVKVGNEYVMDEYGYYDDTWKDWWGGVMAIARRGNKWSMYYAMYDNNVDKNHIARKTRFWVDESEVNMALVSKVMIHIGSHVYGGENPTPTTPTTDYLSYISNIKVQELNVVPVDDTTDPFIFHAGDKLSVDCAKAEILLNGEPFYQYLDPASQFFSLDKGESQLRLSPVDELTTGTITYGERWL